MLGGVFPTARGQMSHYVVENCCMQNFPAGCIHISQAPLHQQKEIELVLGCTLNLAIEFMRTTRVGYLYFLSPVTLFIPGQEAPRMRFLSIA